MGLTKRDQVKDWKKLKEETLLFRSKGYTVGQIVKELNLCDKTITKFLKEEGNFQRKSIRKDYFDENYFEKIDTEDKAYFLGLLYADGNVYLKRNRVQITLINNDGYILEAFQKFIGSTSKLYSDRGKYSKVILGSKKMVNDLIKLGCVPNKSLVLKFPNENEVPNKLLHHFIRGYFDGDGHVSKKKNCFNVTITSSKFFTESLKDLLRKMRIEITELKKRYRDHEESAYQLYIKSNSARSFFNYIYKDSTIFLYRKKDIVDLPEIIIEKKLCKVCNEKHFAKGFCKKHYMKNRNKPYDNL
jgi:hypothetical protein